MATFEITAPDGNRYQVTAPEGATEAQVLDYAKANYQGAAPAAEKPGFVSQTLSNIPGSALKFAKDMVQPILHPIDTAKALHGVASGAAANLTGQSDPYARYGLESPSMAKDKQAAAAAGKMLGERYGGLSELKNTVMTDPVGAAADASMVLSGGGTALARAPGVAGRLATALSATGAAIDPVNIALRGTQKGAQLAEAIGSNTLGFATGAGPAAIREAARSGAAGGAKADAFQSQMRGTAPAGDVVDTAKAALDKMRQDRATAYRNDMGAVSQDKTVLNFAPIDQAVAGVKSTGTYQGKVINASAADTWKQIDDIVRDWKTSNPAQFHTPEGLDALKRAIGDVRDSTEFGTPSRRVADQVYNAVKGQIVAQAPGYAKTMRDYETASEMLREIEKTLSLNPNATIDTKLRKLQSVMRNNANTNYGQRVGLAKALESNGADMLMPQLAGQALNSPTPRGMHGLMAGGLGVGALASNPALVPAMALTSPRLVGEGAYYAGKAGGNAAALAKALADSTGMSNSSARLLLNQIGRQAQPQDDAK